MLKVDISGIIKSPERVLTEELRYENADLYVCGRRLAAERPISVRVSCCYDGEGVVKVFGNISAVFKENCARCGKEIPLSLSVDFEECFLREHSDVCPDASDGYDDSYTFSGEVLDLAAFVDDTILLNYPLVTLCKEDCRGLCPKCGCDLNVGSCNCKDDDEYTEGLSEEEAFARGVEALKAKFTKN